MPDSTLVTTPAAQLRYHDVTSKDGTRLRAWSNGADGPTVLLSNGLGTNPHAWPALLHPDCGVHVIGWNHRGVGGSARPVDGRVDLDAFVEDALSIMDDAGVESAVVASWSVGVTVAFQLAVDHPERVLGILAVAGVPGNTFSTMLAPLRVPGFAARVTMTSLARLTTLTGHPLAPVTRRIPWTNLTSNMLRRSRLINPTADTAELRDLMQEFFMTHPAWYAKLALSVSKHGRVPLSTITVPVTFVAGRWDLLTGPNHMLSASQRIKHSRYIRLDATHFIPVERPAEVLRELRLLLDEVS